MNLGLALGEDQHVKFNASVLKTSDPDALVLSRVGSHPLVLVESNPKVADDPLHDPDFTRILICPVKDTPTTSRLKELQKGPKQIGRAHV